MVLSSSQFVGRGSEPKKDQWLLSSSKNVVL